MFADLFCSLRVAVTTLAFCVVVYAGAVLGIASIAAPAARQGSLVRHDGVVVGSALLAQAFSRPEYVWPRPSAADYAADAAGGSNLASTSPRLRARVAAALERLGASEARPAPAELVLASASGLDPHLSRDAALWQARRVADARGATVEEVVAVITELAGSGPDGIPPGGLVNVLLLNLELDAKLPTPPAVR